MKTFARITGVLLVAFGLLTILSALGLGILGGIRDALRLAGIRPVGRGAGIGGLLLLLFFVGQGVLFAGAGQALILLARLAPQTRLA